MVKGELPKAAGSVARTYLSAITSKQVTPNLGSTVESEALVVVLIVDRPDESTNDDDPLVPFMCANNLTVENWGSVGAFVDGDAPINPCALAAPRVEIVGIRYPMCDNENSDNHMVNQIFLRRLR